MPTPLVLPEFFVTSRRRGCGLCRPFSWDRVRIRTMFPEPGGWWAKGYSLDAHPSGSALTAKGGQMVP